jgi:hypothetical protein
MDAEGSRSGLFYWRTETEVRLGDRVLMKRWLRSALRGTVCYIPGLSRRHAELEDEGVRQWAVRSEDGAVYPILYDPQHFQPPKAIQFVERGEIGLLHPDEHLE